MIKIFAIFKALSKGEELADSTTWKNRQTAVSLLITVLGGVFAGMSMFGLQIEVSNDDILAIAGGIAAAGGIINGLTTVATSKKVGTNQKGA